MEENNQERKNKKIMPKLYEIGFKKVEYGYAIIEADSPEEADRKFKYRDGIRKEFVEPSEDLIQLDTKELTP